MGQYYYMYNKNKVETTVVLNLEWGTIHFVQNDLFTYQLRINYIQVLEFRTPLAFSFIQPVS